MNEIIVKSTIETVFDYIKSQMLKYPLVNPIISRKQIIQYFEIEYGFSNKVLGTIRSSSDVVLKKLIDTDYIIRISPGLYIFVKPGPRESLKNLTWKGILKKAKK